MVLSTRLPPRGGHLSLATLVVLAVLAVLGHGPAAFAYVRATVDGQPSIFLYWPKRKISYFVHEKGVEDVQFPEVLGAVRRSFFTWSAPSCTDLNFDLGGVTSDDRTNLSHGVERPDGRNTIVWREKAWPPRPIDDGSVTADMAALTVLVYSNKTGRIVDADIDLNAFHFFWTATDDKSKIATDVQNVVTHEIGHVIGLGHSSVSEATMFAEVKQGDTSRRDLHADDLKALCHVYPYGGSTPDTLPGIDEVEGASTGCRVAASRAREAWVLGALAALLLLASRARRQT